MGVEAAHIGADTEVDLVLGSILVEGLLHAQDRIGGPGVSASVAHHMVPAICLGQEYREGIIGVDNGHEPRNRGKAVGNGTAALIPSSRFAVAAALVTPTPQAACSMQHAKIRVAEGLQSMPIGKRQFE